MADIDDFPKLQERYGGRYIAEQGGRVVAHALTHGEVTEYVRRMGLGNRPDIKYRFIHRPRRAG